MTLALYIFGLLSLVCFVVGCLRRVWQYGSLPRHLRWELYPVPHEAPGRAAHGGSYFEETEWWTKPRSVNHAGELRVMAEEIFAFDSVRRANRALWWRTLLFHLGMYAVVAYFGLIGLIYLVGQNLEWLERPLAWAGRFGLVLILSGSLTLLRRRTGEKNLRDYTHPADFVHLGFIALTSLVLLAGSFAANAPSPLQVVHSLVRLDTGLHLPELLAAGFFLSFALLAYIPYSHMAHFIAKYFTYHEVRWDDAPNYEVAGSIGRSLSLRPTWSSAHMGSDGTKTWAEITMTTPEQESRR